jgi:hypothetical protein
LYRALDWNLDGKVADYYSRFWYNDAGVSVVSHSQVASQKAILCSTPYYYGRDVLNELPKVTASWLESREIDPKQMFYRRLNIEGHASVGSVSFIIEETGHCFQFNPLDIIKPSSSLRLWLSNDNSDGEAETRTLGWITSDQWTHDRAAREILQELKLAIRYMYGEKGYGLFSRDNADIVNSQESGRSPPDGDSLERASDLS